MCVYERTKFLIHYNILSVFFRQLNDKDIKDTFSAEVSCTYY